MSLTREQKPSEDKEQTAQIEDTELTSKLQKGKKRFIDPETKFAIPVGDEHLYEDKKETEYWRWYRHKAVDPTSFKDAKLKGEELKEAIDNNEVVQKKENQHRLVYVNIHNGALVSEEEAESSNSSNIMELTYSAYQYRVSKLRNAMIDKPESALKETAIAIFKSDSKRVKPQESYPVKTERQKLADKIFMTPPSSCKSTLFTVPHGFVPTSPAKKPRPYKKRKVDGEKDFGATSTISSPKNM